MAAGDRQIIKAMEDAMTNNIRSAIAHGNETRKTTRILEEKVLSLDGLVRQQQEIIEALRQQLSNVQAIVFRGGTSGN
ncbi:MAG: hypothetical protein BBJ57_07210 [Desulfobacterales bacterium PC51MH44]|nr:MAG: hypothetical protein BBJ57_07210 [Desulfobacterales bacterium PC51MH44]